MNLLLLLSHLFSLLLSAFVGIIAIYLGFFIFRKFTINIDETLEIKQNNIAVAIVSSSYIFSLGYLLKPIIATLIQTIFHYIQNKEPLFAFISLAIVMAQFLLAVLLASSVLFLGIKIFHHLTKDLDEWKEIASNNIAVAIISAVIILTLAILIEDSLKNLLEFIVPEPIINNKSLTPFG